MQSIQLKHLYQKLKSEYKILFIIFSLTFVVLFFSNILLNNKYKSESIWIYIAEQESNQLGGIPEEYIGLGSMFGINTPSSDGFEIYVAKLKSRDFLNTMLKDQYFMANILSDSSELYGIDEISQKGIKNVINDKWLIKDVIDYDAIHEHVLSNVVNISYDIPTKIIYFSAKHKNANFAYEIISNFFNTSNQIFRDEQINKSKLKIKFLEEYSKENLNRNINYSISAIAQSELQKIMTASTTENYKFDYIDTPNKPLITDFPSLILQILFLFGFSIASYCAYLFIRYVE